jgi:hypothetical protein
MSFGRKKKGAPAPRQYEENKYGNFQSGFRPYPAGGFMLQPEGNFWDGNDFYMPGINASSPTMRSMLTMPREGGMGAVSDADRNFMMPQGEPMRTPQGPGVGGFGPQAIMEMSAGAGQPAMDPRQMLLSRLKG